MTYPVDVRPAAPLWQTDFSSRGGPRLRGAGLVRAYPITNVLG